MAQKRRILFVPLGWYAFEQQLATARYFTSHGDYEPHFLLISRDDHPFITKLDKEGYPYLALDPVGRGHQQKPGDSKRPPTRDATSATTGILRHLKGFALGLPIGGMGRSLVSVGISLAWTGFLIAPMAMKLWQRKRRAKRLIRPLKPQCAVVSQERWWGFLPVLKALRELKAPVILMLAADSSPEGPAWLRQDSVLLKAGLNPEIPIKGRWKGASSGDALLNKWVAKWMPEQVYDSSWGRMLFTTPAKILALWITGMLPRSLWYQGTTFADYIMISGVDERAVYEEAEVDRTKLLPFGSHELDLLYESWPNRAEIRDRLDSSYRLAGSRRLLILSLPPSMEHEIVPEEVHWRSIHDVLEVLSRVDYQTLISLHPRMRPEEYAWLEERYPVTICKEPLKEVLAAADVFVAAFSSTLKWAVALGIPAINLDLWGLGLERYRDLDGFRNVTSTVELEAALRAIPSSPAGVVAAGGTNLGEGRNGVVMDGKAKERLLRFVNELAPSRVA